VCVRVCAGPGLVAFRQHLQNLARTKGILELNKQLYEQMDSGDGAGMDLLNTHQHLQHFLEVGHTQTLTHTSLQSLNPPTHTHSLTHTLTHTHSLSPTHTLTLSHTH